MAKFRKLPVEIEAVQFVDGAACMGELMDFVDDGLLYMMGGAGLSIKTLEGKRHVSIGDWIIKGVAGEFYPCKPEIFAVTYERV